ncbi:MAG TPA: polysaccharide deacetylase family protein, partial [Myxococcaceae bacterium]|nr:polysaccharide deacetylase family protein [Myxococcaceae bacterium]
LCVVTFDDGYRDVYRYAYPVMKQMGIPAITYLPSAFVGTGRRLTHDRLFHLARWVHKNHVKIIYDALPPAGALLFSDIFSGRKTVSAALDDFIEHTPNGVLTALVDALDQQLGAGVAMIPEQGDLMDWNDVRRMSNDGFDFGAHTLHHTVLTLESPESIEHEVRTSKEALEKELGKPVRDFAYCNGWYSDEVIEALKRNGFRSAVTTEDFYNRIGGDPFTLKRKVLWENFSTGALGDYSSTLTLCQLDDVFGMFRVNNPVLGKRPQTVAPQMLALPPADGREA